MVSIMRSMFLVVTVVLWYNGVVVAAGGSRDLPCPDPGDILPCICTLSTQNEMAMDCSAVTSSDELAQIFSSNLPFMDFNSLNITGNLYLTTIRSGDLGLASFRKITICDGILETVEDNAFSGSYDSLSDLVMNVNSISYFPFQEVEQFKYLQYINLESNTIGSFPIMSSSSLRALYFGFNQLQNISSSALRNLTSLTTIGLQSTGLTKVLPDTFAGLPMLQNIYLEMNELVSLEAGVVDLQTSSNLVHINSNLLTSVAVGSITGLNGDVWLHDNLLTELTEEVWRPLLDEGINMYAAHNPLACGCEIAWLVTNPDYLNHLIDNVTCEDGREVTELDPGEFSNCEKV